MQKRPAVPEFGKPTVSASVAVTQIGLQIASAQQLLAARPVSKDDYSSWELMTRNVLERAFGLNDANVRAITEVGKFGSIQMNPTQTYLENRRVESLRTQVAKLKTLVDVLALDADQPPELGARVAQRPNSIFLVHGHDDRRHQVAGFLRRLIPKVTVLDEEASGGKTVIEKLEANGNCGFAVVLMTGDDRGGVKEMPFENQKARARQNVILELGYFMGRLGRENVCALYEPDVDLPSDYQGVVFVEFDRHGAWKMKLAKEMKAAGLEVDTAALI